MGCEDSSRSRIWNLECNDLTGNGPIRHGVWFSCCSPKQHHTQTGWRQSTAIPQTTSNQQHALTMAAASAPASSDGKTRQIPIVCPGHTRPLAELQFLYVNDKEEQRTFLVSACHGEKTMERHGKQEKKTHKICALSLSCGCADGTRVLWYTSQTRALNWYLAVVVVLLLLVPMVVL